MTKQTIAYALMAAALPLAAAILPAQAADFSRVPPMSAAPRQSWYGTFIGVHGGYGRGGDGITFSGTAVPAGTPTPVVSDPRGGLGGVTYGTNWQFNNLVIGTESDFAFTGIKQRETLGPLAGFTVAVTAEQKLEYLATTRGRIGFVLGDHLLIFGTGGLASGSVESTVSFNNVAPGACGGAGNCPIGSRDKTRWGWSAGAGIEYANGPWSVKIDYLHYDLGDLNYTVVDPTGGGAFTATNKLSGDLVRGGINYRFNWTVWDVLLGRR
jgi:outer membrane immunogenic protein